MPETACSSWSLLNVPASEEMVWGIMTVTSCPVRSVLRPWHSVYFEKDLVCWLSQTSHGFNSMPGASTAKWRTSKHLLICWAALSSNSCSLTYWGGQELWLKSHSFLHWDEIPKKGGKKTFFNFCNYMKQNCTIFENEDFLNKHSC